MLRCFGCCLSSELIFHVHFDSFFFHPRLQFFVRFKGRRLSDGLTGQSGVRNPLAVENVKYQLAQDIIDDKVSSMQDSTEPVEVTGSLFGGIRGAAGYEDYDWEYLKVWSQIVVL